MRPSGKYEKATINDAKMLVDIIIENAVRLSFSEDAGWHQPSIIQLLIEFEGDLPESTGNSRPGNKMIEEIKFLRRADPRLEVASMILNLMPDDQRMAMLAERYYCDRNDTHGVPYNDAATAAEINMNVHTYKKHKLTGYNTLVGGINGHRQTMKSMGLLPLF